MTTHSDILGYVVKDARRSLGLTQNEVAETINVDTRTILNIENSKGNPKLEILYPLIRALKIDPSKIFYPEVQPQDAPTRQMILLLSQCNTSERNAILSICETVLSMLRNESLSRIENK